MERHSYDMKQKLLFASKILMKNHFPYFYRKQILAAHTCISKQISNKSVQRKAVVHFLDPWVLLHYQSKLERWKLETYFRQFSV